MDDLAPEIVIVIHYLLLIITPDHRGSKSGAVEEQRYVDIIFRKYLADTEVNNDVMLHAIVFDDEVLEHLLDLFLIKQLLDHQHAEGIGGEPSVYGVRT